MKRKTVIWFLGSNATGKTTQAKMLHKTLNNGDEGKIFVDMDCEDGCVIKATQYNRSAHVGFLKDNQCTGTDTINSKESIDATFCYLLSIDSIDFIVIDGIMATATWYDIFTQYPELVELHVILLQFDDVIKNLRRVVERRVCKKIDAGGNDGADIAAFDDTVEYELSILPDKTIKNVSGKFTGFKSMFDKITQKCHSHIQINASRPVEQIHSLIMNFLQDDLPF